MYTIYVVNIMNTRIHVNFSLETMSILMVESVNVLISVSIQRWGVVGVHIGTALSVQME